MWLILETLSDGAGGMTTRWSSYGSLFACLEAWRALLTDPPSALVEAQWFAEVYPSGRYP